MIVVDNASRDKTTHRVRQRTNILLIENGKNRGFAAAVNQGVCAAGDSGVIVLLNPDAQISTPLDGFIRSVSKYGVAGGKLIGFDGKPQRGFAIRRFPTPTTLVFELLGLNRLFPRNPVNVAYRFLNLNLDQDGPVDQPAGAFLGFRKNVWAEINGFDETFYPVWFEDVDFCRRAATAGYRARYVASAVAKHEGGHSVGRISTGSRGLIWCVSLLRYAAKHFGPTAYRIVSAAALAGSVPRMLTGIVQSGSVAPGLGYLKSIWVAGLCLVSAKPPKAENW